MTTGSGVADWRSRYMATVASDVRTRDGIGWEFSDFRQADVWAVFRDDAGPFPVLSASRGNSELPGIDDLWAMTSEAVTDLLAGVDIRDDVGWLGKNITGALLLAAADVDLWEGEEWAVELGDDDVPVAWALPGDDRVPFAWLRGHGLSGQHQIDIYQDDANFGLDFISTWRRELPAAALGGLRPRRDIPVVTGRIRGVEVVLDTVVDGSLAPGVVTEVLLHGEERSTLLIAAEAYARDEWHLYDESVVVVPDLEAADSLVWVPERPSWNSTVRPSRAE
ncbi:MAG: hypothetical protein KDB63_18785 [Nocardioidaceae bacterium]|nr:hypothetical protein [Nocardioidaceae bacterium]